TAKANTSLPASGSFFLPNGVFGRVLPDKMRLPSVDAYNVTVQYQFNNKMSVEAAYVGNKGTHVFAGDGPDFSVNQIPIAGFRPGRDGNLARPFFQKFGWKQDVNFFCNCADNHYDAIQLKLDKRFSDGYSLLMHYTYQHQVQEDGGYFFFDSSLNRGPAGWSRDHTFVLSQVYELPFGKGKKFINHLSTAADYLIGGLQFNSNTPNPRRPAFGQYLFPRGISATR